MLQEVAIRFPHLGIEIGEFAKGFSIFGFFIAFYGVIIACGMVIGIAMACREAKVTGQKSDDYIDIGLAGIIVGVICARIYYVAFEWDYYGQHLNELFSIRNGGLAIYGGIIGAILTAIVMSKIKKIPFGLLMDTVAPSIITGQIIGRWGNFMNREAFGGFTDGLFAMQIRVQDAAYTTPDLLEKMVTVNGVDYIQVHPTFLYESLWNLCVLIVLLLYRRHKKFDGEVVLMYLAGYGLGRVWIEGLRTDQLRIHGTAIPVSQLLSAVLVVVAILLIIILRGRVKRKMMAGLHVSEEDLHRETEEQKKEEMETYIEQTMDDEA